MWDLILHDPVAWGSILGIGIMVVMGQVQGEEV